MTELDAAWIPDSVRRWTELHHRAVDEDTEHHRTTCSCGWSGPIFTEHFQRELRHRAHRDGDCLGAPDCGWCITEERERLMPKTEPSMPDDDKPHFPRDDLVVDFGKPAETIKDPGFMARVREQKRNDDERREREMQERLRQARADRIAAFVVWNPYETPVYLCPMCGDLTADREKHLDHHAALAETAAAAHEASWRNRPIG